jgi:hypothetical protein
MLGLRAGFNNSDTRRHFTVHRNDPKDTYNELEVVLLEHIALVQCGGFADVYCPHYTVQYI